MTDRLNQVSVLVTAAGQGIGRVAAPALADEGARVLATDLDPQAAEALAHEHRNISGQKLDVGDAEAMLRLVRAVLPGMLDEQSGSIIDIASVAPSLNGVPRRCAYGASKAAVIGLGKSIAAGLVGSGIRGNAICSGTVERPSLHNLQEAHLG